MEYWHLFKKWFLGLGGKYNVNPYIFGAIYVGAIPLFFWSSYRMINKIRNKKPFGLFAFLTGFFFISAYLYLVIVGKNIPIWVYIFIGIMVLYGTLTAFKKIKNGIRK